MEKMTPSLSPHDTVSRSREAPVIGRAVWITLAVLTVVRLIAAAYAGLSEDEAYYRLWALAPSYGYLDHPPMVAWWIAAGQWLLGDNALAIRLLSVLSVVVGTLALWRTAWILSGSKRLADRAALWLQAAFLVGIGAVVMTPDTPSVMFWGLSLWAVAELDRSQNPRWLLAMGCFAGLGLVSKYSGLFFGAGFVLWIVTDRASRRWWRSPYLYLGGLLAVLVFLPVIYWNATHGWVSFAKQFGRAVGHRFTLRYLGEFIGTEIGLLNPLIALFCGLGVVMWLRKRGAHARATWLLVATSAPFLAYLTAHSFHDRVQANWPAPLFPSLVLIAASAAHGMSSARTAWKWLRWAVAPFGIGLSVAALAWSVYPLGKTDAKGDPTARTRGWEQLAADVDHARAAAGATWIATDRYAMTGTMGFQLRHSGTPVVALSERIRYINLPEPSPALLRSPGLYVTLDRNDSSAELKQFFTSVEPLGTIRRAPRGRELGIYAIYLISGPVSPGVSWDSISRKLTPSTSPTE
jgi:4-amino-4-deoxy-L-arabinose transferase-like glycosyltransferase